MIREIKTAAVAAACCTVAGAGLVGCEGDSLADGGPFSPGTPKAAASLITGTTKIRVGGTSGRPASWPAPVSRTPSRCSW